MLSDLWRWDNIKGMTRDVLILVLMEYALWQFKNTICNKVERVLILVLMEYALWPDDPNGATVPFLCVLILVLMEYALWR